LPLFILYQIYKGDARMTTRSTDFPIPKSELYYYDENENVLKPLVDVDGLVKVNVENSDIMQPIEIQGRLSTTIQTHNGTSIAKDQWASGAWIDTVGYSEIAVTLLMDAGTNNSVALEWSNDGVNKHGGETLLGVSTAKERAGSTPTKARYVRVSVQNSDTVTTPHTVSAWAYLKA
jgi:hypothetical protein